MGIVHFGIPEEETRWLCDALGLDTAVETGTYKGETARLLGTFNRKVYTIEKSETMAGIARQTLSGFDHVRLLQGDTREHLPGLVATNDNILFWLDAHWCGGMTYGAEDECPLLEELHCIFESNVTNCAILIDDARLFTSPPPLPHAYHQWPTLKEIVQVVPDAYQVYVLNDVIYILPDTMEVVEFMRDRSRQVWVEYGRQKSYTLQNRAKALLKRVLRSSQRMKLDRKGV